jgi:ribulose-phosphate 3-epimerase
MSVNPGFGGQKFIENTIDKVRRLKNLIDSKSSHALIEIDGGVNLETGHRLIEAGADILVAGSFVFHAENPLLTIQKLKSL